MKIKYRKIKKQEICPELFYPFDRHQEVTHCYRKEEGEWVIREISFVEEWGEAEKKYLAECLKRTVESGGNVYGAFERKILIGFACVEAQRFGKDREYVELSALHISNGYRGRGIGTKLFEKACRSAQRMGAKKLYISSHSAVETQNFYQSVGCVEAIEYRKEAVEKEPCDCQLECRLQGIKAYRGVLLVLGVCAGGLYGNRVLGMTVPGLLAGLCFSALLVHFLDNKKTRLPQNGLPLSGKSILHK